MTKNQSMFTIRKTIQLTLFVALLSIFASCSGSRKSTTSKNNSNKATTENVVNIAKSYIGTPYQFGGTTRSGMDCSGLVNAVFSAIGIKIPRVSYQIATVGSEVDKNNLKEGDLVFFVTGSKSGINHVGIVTLVNNDDITFVHSSNTGVREDSLNSKYYQKTFVKATRPY